MIPSSRHIPAGSLAARHRQPVVSLEASLACLPPSSGGLVPATTPMYYLAGLTHHQKLVDAVEVRRTSGAVVDWLARGPRDRLSRMIVLLATQTRIQLLNRV